MDDGGYPERSPMVPYGLDSRTSWVNARAKVGQFHPSLHGGLSVERSGALVSELAPPLAVDD